MRVRFLSRLCIVTLLLQMAGCAAVNNSVINDLQSGTSGERAERLLILRLPDGRELPLRFIEADQQLWLGAGGSWWRQLRTAKPVQVYLRGQWHEATGVAILDDRAQHRSVFRQLRGTAFAWLPRWLGGGVLVRVTLAS